MTVPRSRLAPAVRGRSPSPASIPLPPGRVAWGAAIGLALIAGACRPEPDAPAPPVPPAGLAPVTRGEVIQLRLAIEAIETVFSERSEELDLLPLLVHAWATLYHVADPGPRLADRYAFTERLCRRRLPRTAPHFHACLDGLRLALYDDVAAMAEAWGRLRAPDRIGDFSLRQIAREVRTKRRLQAEALPRRQERREAVGLLPVTRCGLEQPDGAVVSLTRTMVVLNGFPVVTVPPASAGAVPADDWASFHRQLEGRITESRAAGTGTPSLVVSLDPAAAPRTAHRVLATATALGMGRVCLKAWRRSGFGVPCCLSATLFPNVVRSGARIQLDGNGLVRFPEDGGAPEPLPAPTADDFEARLKQRLGAQLDSTYLLVRPGAPVRELLLTVAALSALRGDRPVELVPAPAHPGEEIP